MERDEHEMLIEYSEMTTFDFNSKEFEEVRKDYIKCKNLLNNFLWSVENLVSNFKESRNY